MSVRRLTGEALTYSVGSVLDAGAGIGVVAVLGRYLTPAQLGVVDVITATAGLLYFVIGLNLDQALIRYYYSEDDQGKRQLATTHALFPLISGTLVVIGGALVVRALGPLLTEHAAWVCSLVMMVSLALGDHVTTLFRIRHEPMHHLVLLGVRAVGWFLGVSALLVVWNAGIISVFAGRLFGVWLGLAASLRWLRGVYARGGRVNQARRSIRFAAPTIPATLASWAILYAPRYFLAAGASYDEVGYYGIGVRIAYFVPLLGISVFMAWMPHIMGIKDRPEMPATLGRGFLLFLVLNVLMVVPLAAFSRELVRLFVGPNFIAASGLVAIVLAAMVFGNMSIFLFAQLSLSERTHWQSISYAGGLGVMAACNLALIPLWQSKGAAVATLAGQIAAATMMFVAARRLVRFPVAPVRTAATLCCFGIVVFSASFLAGGVPGRGSLLAKGALVLFGWGTCALVLGMREIRAIVGVSVALLTRKGEEAHA